MTKKENSNTKNLPTQYDYFIKRNGEIFARSFVIKNKKKIILASRKIEKLSNLDIHTCSCELQNKVTLKSIIELIKTDYTFWTTYCHPDIEKIANRILEGKSKKRRNIKAFDFRWANENWINPKKDCDISLINEGVKIAEVNLWLKDGRRIGSDLQEVCTLKNVPIIFETRFFKVKTYLEHGLKKSKLEFYYERRPTLFELIYSLFDELGWCKGDDYHQELKMLSPSKKSIYKIAGDFLTTVHAKRILDLKKKGTLDPNVYEFLFQKKKKKLSDQSYKKNLNYNYRPTFSYHLKKNSFSKEGIVYRCHDENIYSALQGREFLSFSEERLICVLMEIICSRGP